MKSLKSGQNWEKMKKRTKCSACGEHPPKPYITSCHHVICDSCLEQAYLVAAEKAEEHAVCASCGMRFHYTHPCDSDDEDSQTNVAHGTRSQTKKKKNKEYEDISADWLNSLGDEVLASAKTIAVKAQCLNWFKKDSNSKIIIYTQFLTM